MTKRRVDENTCSVCGTPYKKVSGIWRCTPCKSNKLYEIDDGRPKEHGRVVPMFEDEDSGYEPVGLRRFGPW